MAQGSIAPPGTAENSAPPSSFGRAADQPVVEVFQLRKSYGAIEALRGIDLEVRPGEIFGLIGPDGAGKTSLLHILSGIMDSTAGRATVFGELPQRSREHVGYLTQRFSLYPDLTVLENLEYLGALRRVPAATIKARSLRYLALFGMSPFKDRLAGDLSGGMKQKLALACSLVAEPRVLLLDEPTTGVDPVSRREFWDAITQLSRQGMTIVVATPYLDEAERCHRIALMHEGAIYRIGTPQTLRMEGGLSRLELHTNDLGRAEYALAASGTFPDVQRFGDRLDVLVKDPAAGEQRIRATLAAAGIDADEIHSSDPMLENTFVAALRALDLRPAAPAFPICKEKRANTGSAIEACDLSRRFGSFQAVRKLSLNIRYGEIYGLLGANGAGKTTTIKMLCGLLPASSGSIALAGERSKLRSTELRNRLGYMSQRFSLYDDLTVRENLAFFAGVYELPHAERESKISWVLQFAGLADRAKSLTGDLPGGWKQRVAFGAAMMHEPEVLFLDEPTSGVDPIARRAMWSMINRLADLGTAILVTTHYLEEAEQCNRLGIMVGGDLVAEGAPQELKRLQRGAVLDLLCEPAALATDIMKQEFEGWRVSQFGDRVHVIVDGSPDAETKRLAKILARAGITLRQSRVRPYSLEDVFLSVVARAQHVATSGE